MKGNIWKRQGKRGVSYTVRGDLGPDAYAEIVRTWLDAGANTVGGCCQMGPDHIAALRAMIDGHVAARR